MWPFCFVFISLKNATLAKGRTKNLNVLLRLYLSQASPRQLTVFWFALLFFFLSHFLFFPSFHNLAVPVSLAKITKY